MFATNRSLGIDLKDNRLRLAYLAAYGKKIKLLNYTSLPLPPLNDGTLSEYETAFVESLRNFIGKNHIKPKQVIIGLPQKDIIFRKIEIPAVKPEEINQILEFEKLRHIPFVDGEVNFDYQIIRRKEPNKLELILAAAKKERIAYLLSLFKSAGLSYNRLELTTFALFVGLHPQLNQIENYVIIDVGLEEIEFALIQNNKFVFSHSADKNTPPIARLIKIEADTENLEKIQAPMDEEIRILADKISEETRLLLTGWQQNNKDLSVQNLFISGAGAKTLLADYLEACLGIAAKIWDPALGINADGIKLPPEGAAAVGLALEGMPESVHGLNLLPPEEQTVREENSVVAPIVLGVILSLLLATLGASYLIKERQELERTNKQIAELKPQLAEIEKLTTRYRQFEEQKGNLLKLTHKTLSVLEVLKELTIKLPTDVWLDNFKMTHKEVEIAGYAESASNLVPMLEASRLFRDVQFTSAITTGGITDEGKEKFKLKIRLESQEDSEAEEENGAAR
ncbi:MAG: pilus assembly protein PilM [Candidatus Schekmanbacteria bacterium]|nr:pilus assembly protein PilM [Candidatus Schekmanbacteria bacterium]